MEVCDNDVIRRFKECYLERERIIKERRRKRRSMSGNNSKKIILLPSIDFDMKYTPIVCLLESVSLVDKLSGLELFETVLRKRTSLFTPWHFFIATIIARSLFDIIEEDCRILYQKSEESLEKQSSPMNETIIKIYEIMTNITKNIYDCDEYNIKVCEFSLSSSIIFLII